MECLEPPTIYYNKSTYVTTKRQNKVSKQSVLCGSDNIGVQGKTIIEADAVIRGDLATIEIGVHCLLSSHAILRPPPQRNRTSLAYIPQQLSDYTFIGSHSLVEAATVGPYTSIGHHCLIGKRAVIATCCLIRDGCVIVEQTVCPPLSVWEGNPGRQVGRLPDCWREMWMEHCRQYFKHFLPLPSTSASGSPRGSVTSGGASGASGGAAKVVGAGSTVAGGGGDGGTAAAAVAVKADSSGAGSGG